jgi:hypothetical protein
VVHICNGAPRVEGNVVRWSFLETGKSCTSLVWTKRSVLSCEINLHLIAVFVN